MQLNSVIAACTNNIKMAWLPNSTVVLLEDKLIIALSLTTVTADRVYMSEHLSMRHITYGPLLWPGPFYGHLLYLALPEYSAIPLLLHMRSHAKVT